MHKLLQRQLKKSGAIVDEKFLQLVNQAYLDSDEDRKLLERSLEISSQEMRELYETLKKSSEQKLKASEDRLQRLLYELRNQYFLYSYNKDFTIIDVSESIENILGYTQEEIINTKITDYYSDEDMNKESLKLAKKTTQGEETDSRIISVLHKDGNKHYLEIDSFTLYNDAGEAYGAEGLAKDITSQYTLQQELDYISKHDSLTGLANRHSLYNDLEYIIKNAKRKHQSFTVFYLDLDNFKKVNDSLGHHKGDLLLQQFAHLLKEHSRENDVVARIGGDEFIIIYTDIESNSKEQLAQKLFANIQKEIVPIYKEFQLSASIGISTYPQDGSSVQELLKSADKAMYAIKKRGKNNFTNC